MNNPQTVEDNKIYVEGTIILPEDNTKIDSQIDKIDNNDFISENTDSYNPDLDETKHFRLRKLFAKRRIQAVVPEALSPTEKQVKVGDNIYKKVKLLGAGGIGEVFLWKSKESQLAMKELTLPPGVEVTAQGQYILKVDIGDTVLNIDFISDIVVPYFQYINTEAQNITSTEKLDLPNFTIPQEYIYNVISDIQKRKIKKVQNNIYNNLARKINTYTQNEGVEDRKAIDKVNFLTKCHEEMRRDFILSFVNDTNIEDIEAVKKGFIDISVVKNMKKVISQEVKQLKPKTLPEKQEFVVARVCESDILKNLDYALEQSLAGEKRFLKYNEAVTRRKKIAQLTKTANTIREARGDKFLYILQQYKKNTPDTALKKQIDEIFVLEVNKRSKLREEDLASHPINVKFNRAMQEYVNNSMNSDVIKKRAKMKLKGTKKKDIPAFFHRMSKKAQRTHVIFKDILNSQAEIEAHTTIKSRVRNTAVQGLFALGKLVKNGRETYLGTQVVRPESESVDSMRADISQNSSITRAVDIKTPEDLARTPIGVDGREYEAGVRGARVTPDAFCEELTTKLLVQSQLPMEHRDIDMNNIAQHKIVKNEIVHNYVQGVHKMVKMQKLPKKVIKKLNIFIRKLNEHNHKKDYIGKTHTFLALLQYIDASSYKAPGILGKIRNMHPSEMFEEMYGFFDFGAGLASRKTRENMRKLGAEQHRPDKCDPLYVVSKKTHEANEHIGGRNQDAHNDYNALIASMYEKMYKLINPQNTDLPYTTYTDSLGKKQNELDFEKLYKEVEKGFIASSENLEEVDFAKNMLKVIFDLPRVLRVENLQEMGMDRRIIDQFITRICGNSQTNTTLFLDATVIIDLMNAMRRANARKNKLGSQKDYRACVQKKLQNIGWKNKDQQYFMNSEIQFQERTIIGAFKQFPQFKKREMVQLLKSRGWKMGQIQLFFQGKMNIHTILEQKRNAYKDTILRAYTFINEAHKESVLERIIVAHPLEKKTEDYLQSVRNFIKPVHESIAKYVEKCVWCINNGKFDAIEKLLKNKVFTNLTDNERSARDGILNTMNARKNNDFYIEGTFEDNLFAFFTLLGTRWSNMHVIAA